MYNTKHFFEGGFGIERETLRTNNNGKLAQTSHPFDNSKLERDFCENQLEIITGVHSDVRQAVNELENLDRYASEILSKQNEYLWRYSNPPHFGSENEIPVAKYSGESLSKYFYRKKLEEKYGKRLMLYSGIHFNFSFSEDFLKELYYGKSDFLQHKNNLYFRLMKQLCRYSWLLVLLTAASPVYDKSLDAEGETGTAFCGYGSMRNSKRGYWNKFEPILDYSSIESFAESVKSYVEKGLLISPAELYLPVRLKPKGEYKLEMLIKNGINHIELRMFDLNPLSGIGIFAEDLEFAHIFMLYLLSLPDFVFSVDLQKAAFKNHMAAAEYDIEKMIINGYPAAEAALGLLNDMEYFYKGYEKAKELIALQKDKITHNSRYCVKLFEKLTTGDDIKCANCLVQV